MTKEAIAKAKSRKWYASKDQMLGGVGVVPAGTLIDVSGFSDVEFADMVKKDLIVSEEPESAPPAASVVDEPKPSKSKVAKPSKKKGK